MNLWLGLDRYGTAFRPVTLSIPAGRFHVRNLFREFPLTSKTTRRDTMTLSTKDQIQGALHEAKGAVKEQVGKATNNPALVGKGQSEKFAGKVQKKLGQIEKVLEK
jgi:uncharacterized protein YjbJ (UPF0337 family)